MHMKNGTEQAGLVRGAVVDSNDSRPDRPLTFDVLRLSDT